MSRHPHNGCCVKNRLQVALRCCFDRATSRITQAARPQKSPAFMDSLEACWEYDELLDTEDPVVDGTELDNSAIPLAGVLVLPPIQAQPLRRRVPEFVSSAGTEPEACETRRRAVSGSSNSIESEPLKAIVCGATFLE